MCRAWAFLREDGLCGTRLDSLDLFLSAIRDVEIEIRLHVHPRLWSHAEIARQAQRHVGRESAFFTYQIVHARQRNTEILCHAIRSEIQRSHKLLAQNRTRMYRICRQTSSYCLSSARHGCHSMFLFEKATTESPRTIQ